MSLSRLLTLWQHTPQIAENIAAWETRPARTPRWAPLPAGLHPALHARLRALGFEALYTHQAQSWELARAGRHLAVATGTASGKTLCYNLPVLDTLLQRPKARALYLFPTKALAQDQHAGLARLLSGLEGAQPAMAAPAPAVYDGDTPRTHRPAIRENARIVLSNPDMVHMGILPYHTRWAEFFRHLQFIVIDEMHVYRGVFGSHVANVLRRLKRVCEFHGARPQFILTSATIGNPVELAERLVEAPISLIDEDGSGRGAQHFVLYNPPIIQPELGLRRGALQESVYLTSDLLAYDVQTLLFARSRRAVELALKNLRENALPASGSLAGKDSLRAYRSGYLPRERREIERGLRAGTVRAVAATNALELGVDIGGMDAVVMAGYPGTIAATWQQAGRGGRGDQPSVAVLVTSASPLDQFLALHPGYFFGRSPERALINPDNPLILLDHLRCAAFELPFSPGEGFGLVTGAVVAEYLDFLAQTGELTPSAQKFFWTSSDYPAQNISLRTASPKRVLLQTGAGPQGEASRTIGEVDGDSAPWMVHPGAIYLHDAASFLVESLDQENGLAQLRPIETDYYTEAKRDTDVALVEQAAFSPVAGGCKAHGDIQVTTQVTGFRKIQWWTQARLGEEVLEMPPSHLLTTGYWVSLGEETVEALQAEGVWNSSPNAYGPTWPRLREAARARDGYRCQSCGAPEDGRAHDVHHRTPFRAFASPEQANQLANLVTLCPACHRRAEAVGRVRTGLAGLGHVLGSLAPLFLMCDAADLHVHTNPQSPLGEGRPTVVIYEQVPGGVGLSASLYASHGALVAAARELVAGCGCTDGCPSCVGPGGESGAGGKEEARAILGNLVIGH